MKQRLYTQSCVTLSSGGIWQLRLAASGNIASDVWQLYVGLQYDTMIKFSICKAKFSLYISIIFQL